MIAHKDENSTVECPFCNLHDECNHLFILYNRQFREIEGGYLFDTSKLDVLIDPYSELFRDFVIKYGRENDKLLYKHLSEDLKNAWSDLHSDLVSFKVDAHNAADNWVGMPRQVLDHIIGIIEYEETAISVDGATDFGPGNSFDFKIMFSDELEKSLQETLKFVLLDVEKLRQKLEV